MFPIYDTWLFIETMRWLTKTFSSHNVSVQSKGRITEATFLLFAISTT